MCLGVAICEGRGCLPPPSQLSPFQGPSKGHFGASRAGTGAEEHGATATGEAQQAAACLSDGHGDVIRPLRKQVELLFNTRYGEQGAGQGQSVRTRPPFSCLCSQGHQAQPPIPAAPCKGTRRGRGGRDWDPLREFRGPQGD